MSNETETNIIVLADDDQDDRMIVTDIFSAHSKHLTVLNASDGEEVLHTLKLLIAKDITPCLIILDLNMPKMGGKDALLQIKTMQQLDDVPVVIFSTSTSPSDQAFAKAHGADYINKPLNYTKMENVVKAFIQLCTIKN